MRKGIKHPRKYERKIYGCAKGDKIMKYAFFPGCVLKDTASELMISTKKIAEVLGIELVEIDGWTCCGVSHAGDINPMMAHTMNARNLALAENMGADKVMTVCNTCTLMLKKTELKTQKNDRLKEQVNTSLEGTGLEYKGTIQVTHLLWALIEDYGLENLKVKIKRPLTGLKVANFYGCHIMMPPKYTGFENWRNPQSMETIVELLGATNVDYENRLSCCGFHAMSTSEKEVMKMTEQGANTAKEAGADVIVTPCPLCQMQFDDQQQAANKSLSGEDNFIPVIHLPQLIGLALGIAPRELGMEKHTIEVISVIEEALK